MFKIFIYKWVWGECRHFCFLCKHHKAWCTKEELLDCYDIYKGNK